MNNLVIILRTLLNTNEDEKMYKSIDLFAGIGGIRLGFDQAFKNDIKTVFISEWDEKAMETYKANFGDNIDVVGDITEIDEKDIPSHDILLAGFPCQAFSLAGHKKGFEDARGTLFFDVARIIKYHRPKVVFCENVKNLVNHDRGRTFQIIRNILEELSYAVFYQVLNSKDFGVPQNRERIYIVAFRNDIAPSDFVFPQKTDDTKVIKDIVEENEVSSKYYLSTAYLTSLKRHKVRHISKGNGFGYEVREATSVAGAIVCGGMGRERNLIIDERLTDFTPVTHIKGEVNREYIRKMTPREWARLQGFPDEFKLPVADTHLYKQFGNSVTVPVIRAIAEQIKLYLEKVNAETKKKRIII
ncbi:DNA cytosine methyltransferase [Treponema pedis]|nr:DNA cytosine methyltransferase [Treponema pedis]